MLGAILAQLLFAPVLALAALGGGTLVVLFLLVDPGLGAWTDTLLVARFGWNAATRHFRLDALILALLQPPLFAGLVTAFYADDVRSFLRSHAGRGAGLAVSGTFLALATYFLATNEVTASGVPPAPQTLAAPIRQATPVPAFQLVDHRGARATADTLRGRPVVLLVDRAGRIAFTYRGLAHPEAGQAADLARLVRERA